MMDLVGKRVAVTGSTGGLGRELCTYLAERGASLVLVDRNAARSEDHRQSLLERFENIDVRCITLDLEDLSSAESVAQRLTELGTDVFVHNAGAYGIPRRKCSSGHGNVFQINFVTPYCIIRNLLPSLRERGGKVVAVSSLAHAFSRTDSKDIDFDTRRSAARVYGNAKRYLTFSLFELFRDEREAHLSIVHPGICLTNITSNYPRLISAIIKYPMKLIFMSPKKAALSILEGVLDETAYCEWIGPRVLGIWGKPKKKKLRTCSEKERLQIADISTKIFYVLKENNNGI